MGEIEANENNGLMKYKDKAFMNKNRSKRENKYNYHLNI